MALVDPLGLVIQEFQDFLEFLAVHLIQYHQKDHLDQLRLVDLDYHLFQEFQDPLEVLVIQVNQMALNCHWVQCLLVVRQYLVIP